MQTRNPNNPQGIDVSHNNGTIDWLAVAAAGYKFAYVKASEGVGYIDQQFRRNAVGAPAAGLKVGFYHYARPETENTSQQEAEAFLEAIAGLQSDLPHVLDVEGKAADIGPTSLTNWVYEWLSIVQRRTGQRVMIYTGAAFARSYLGVKLEDFPLWVAHYGGVDRPMGNNVWDTWAAFQYDNQGEVPGIDSSVDRDEMDAEFWEELFGGMEKKTNFSDVEAGRWSEGAIAAIAEAGIMEGFEDGTFHPEEPVTREQLAKVCNDLLYLINSKASGQPEE